MEFNAAKSRMFQNYRVVAVSPLEATESRVTSGAFDVISILFHC